MDGLDHGRFVVVDDGPGSADLQTMVGDTADGGVEESQVELLVVLVQRIVDQPHVDCLRLLAGREGQHADSYLVVPEVRSCPGLRLVYHLCGQDHFHAERHLKRQRGPVFRTGRVCHGERQDLIVDQAQRGPVHRQAGYRAGQNHRFAYLEDLVVHRRQREPRRPRTLVCRYGDREVRNRLEGHRDVGTATRYGNRYRRLCVEDIAVRRGRDLDRGRSLILRDDRGTCREVEKGRFTVVVEDRLYAVIVSQAVLRRRHEVGDSHSERLGLLGNVVVQERDFFYLASDLAILDDQHTLPVDVVPRGGGRDLEGRVVRRDPSLGRLAIAGRQPDTDGSGVLRGLRTAQHLGVRRCLIPTRSACNGRIRGTDRSRHDQDNLVVSGICGCQGRRQQGKQTCPDGGFSGANTLESVWEHSFALLLHLSTTTGRNKRIVTRCSTLKPLPINGASTRRATPEQHLP